MQSVTSGEGARAQGQGGAGRGGDKDACTHAQVLLTPAGPRPVCLQTPAAPGPPGEGLLLPAGDREALGSGRCSGGAWEAEADASVLLSSRSGREDQGAGQCCERGCGHQRQHRGHQDCGGGGEHCGHHRGGAQGEPGLQLSPGRENRQVLGPPPPARGSRARFIDRESEAKPRPLRGSQRRERLHCVSVRRATALRPASGRAPPGHRLLPGAAGEQRPLVVDGGEAPTTPEVGLPESRCACVHAREHCAGCAYACVSCARTVRVFIVQGVCACTCALCGVRVVMHARVRTRMWPSRGCRGRGALREEMPAA